MAAPSFPAGTETLITPAPQQRRTSSAGQQGSKRAAAERRCGGAAVRPPALSPLRVARCALLAVAFAAAALPYALLLTGHLAVAGVPRSEGPPVCSCACACLGEQEAGAAAAGEGTEQRAPSAAEGGGGEGPTGAVAEAAAPPPPSAPAPPPEQPPPLPTYVLASLPVSDALWPLLEAVDAAMRQRQMPPLLDFLPPTQHDDQYGQHDAGQYGCDWCPKRVRKVPKPGTADSPLASLGNSVQHLIQEVQAEVAHVARVWVVLQRFADALQKCSGRRCLGANVDAEVAQAQLQAYETAFCRALSVKWR